MEIGQRVTFVSILHRGVFLGTLIAREDFNHRIGTVKLDIQDAPVTGVLIHDEEPQFVLGSLWQACWPVQDG